MINYSNRTYNMNIKYVAAIKAQILGLTLLGIIIDISFSFSLNPVTYIITSI